MSAFSKYIIVLFIAYVILYAVMIAMDIKKVTSKSKKSSEDFDVSDMMSQDDLEAAQPEEEEEEEQQKEQEQAPAAQPEVVIGESPEQPDNSLAFEHQESSTDDLSFGPSPSESPSEPPSAFEEPEEETDYDKELSQQQADEVMAKLPDQQPIAPEPSFQDWITIYKRKSTTVTHFA